MGVPHKEYWCDILDMSRKLICCGCLLDHGPSLEIERITVLMQAEGTLTRFKEQCGGG